MSNKLKKILILYISLGVLFIALCLGYIYNAEQSYQNQSLKAENIKFIGDYTVLGKQESQPIPADGRLGLTGHNTVILNGSFNADIPKNNLITFRIDNMHVRVFLDEQLIYSFGDEETFPEFAKSPGNLWNSFISPGITQNDKLRIELSNIYTNRVDTNYAHFLNEIYYGYDSELIVENLRSKIFNVFASLFILCLGVIALIFSIALLHIHQPNLSIFCFACLSLWCGIWFFIDFNIQNYFIPYPVFNNSLDIVSLLISAVFSLIYVAVSLKSRAKILLFTYACLCMLLAIVATIAQLLGIYDYYEFIPEINIATLCAVILITGSVLYEKKCYKDSKNYLTIPAIILCVGMFVDLTLNFFQIIYFTLWSKIGFFIFVIIQFWGIISFLKQIISEYTKVQVLQLLAYNDALTGVKNRTAYLEKTKRLESQIKDKNAKFAVIVFDINNLKKTNDNLGHEYGDIMIINTCKTICATFKKSPVYRIGGDEFVVILENSDLEAWDELKLIFEQEVENYNQNPTRGITISIAYGIATFDPNKDFDFNDIFKRADEKMYREKIAMKRLLVDDF